MMVKDQLFELIGTLLIGNRIITGGSTLKSESSYEGPDFFCFWGGGGCWEPKKNKTPKLTSFFYFKIYTPHTLSTIVTPQV